MRISRIEIVAAIIIGVIIATSYGHVSGELAGVSAEYKWATYMTGMSNPSLREFLPEMMLGLLAIALLFARRIRTTLARKE